MKQNPISEKADQAIIIDYIYGELSPEQKRQILERANSDQRFHELLMGQLELEKISQLKNTYQASQTKLSTASMSLHRKLQSLSSQSADVEEPSASFFTRLWQQQVSIKVQLASMLLTFILGGLSAGSGLFGFDTLSGGAHQQVTSNSGEQLESSPLSLIAAGDYQIVDLQLSKERLEQNQIKVKYSLSSQTEVDGLINDTAILNLLIASIKYEVSDSARLEVIEVLKNYTDNKKVRKALSYSLLNDLNPGVRVAAAESLVSLSEDANIRSVLRQALQSDINSGIRVQAFQALVSHLDDPETMQLLKTTAVKDSNSYIRNQARYLIQLQNRQA